MNIRTFEVNNEVIKNLYVRQTVAHRPLTVRIMNGFFPCRGLFDIILVCSKSTIHFSLNFKVWRQQEPGSSRIIWELSVIIENLAFKACTGGTISWEIMIPVVIILLTAVLCRATENPLAQYLQPDASFVCPWVKINYFIIFEFIWLFSVPDLRNDCIENCEIEKIECFSGCNNDSACLRECLRGETDCINCKLQFNSC